MNDLVNELKSAIKDALVANGLDPERLVNDPEYRKDQIVNSLRGLYNEPADPGQILDSIRLVISTVSSFEEQDQRDVVFSYAHALGEKLVPVLGGNPVQDVLNIVGSGPGNAKVVEVDLSPVD